MSSLLHRKPAEVIHFYYFRQVKHVNLERYRNFASAHLKPLHNIVESMFGAVCSDSHRRFIIGTKEVMISISLRHISPVFAEIEY